MHRLNQFYLRHKESILYILFGVLSMVLNIVIFAVFDYVLGKKLYLITNLIAWTITIVFAFFANKHIVFGSKSNDKNTLLREGLEFLGARAISLGLEECGLWFLLDIAKMKFITSGDLIAKVLMSVIVVLVNYLISKFIIFKKK